ncbi:MAG: hypothetical protein M1541_22345, partial [Acidobacteria bacterium]|nr:hypothetical protein [Acidobacteriota bacterium]
ESARTANFTVQTQRPHTRSVATIVARYRDAHAAYLVIDYAHLRSVFMLDSWLGTHNGLIYLTIPAPPGGLSCTLSSSHPERIAVPSHAPAPERALRAPFPYTVRSSRQGPVTVSALCDGITKSTTVEIRSGLRK